MGFPLGFDGLLACIINESELPKNWDKLVAKYKGIVPHYEKY